MAAGGKYMGNPQGATLKDRPLRRKLRFAQPEETPRMPRTNAGAERRQRRKEKGP